MDWNTLLNPNRRRSSTGRTPEHRQQFERDYDRTLFSTPLRRLQDKAQVFPLDPNDSVRTRLTHSLEVSTLSRGIATKAAQWLQEQKEISGGMDRQIEAIAATCGLIHDFGHPPFGHAGEDAIREWFDNHLDDSQFSELWANPRATNDLRSFEGNAQTLRLVAKLQVLSDFNGLNLTYGTLSASRKYIAFSDEIEEDKQERKKVGQFASEAELVADVACQTGTEGCRNPIAYLVEAADDIVYSLVDLEDAVTKGIFDWQQLMEKIRYVLDGDTPILDEVVKRQHRILERGEDEHISDRESVINARAFRTAAIGVLVEKAVSAFRIHYTPIMNGTFHSSLMNQSEGRPLVEAFKNVGKTHVYQTDETLRLECMGHQVIHDLMTFFWHGAQRLSIDGGADSKAASLMSRNYKDVCINAINGSSEIPEMYHRLQLVTDYVCGMTDGFARTLHKEIKNG